ncbi:MAG: hypothetical protein QM571_02260 [Micrococcaceae bacterium]
MKEHEIPTVEELEDDSKYCDYLEALDLLGYSEIAFDDEVKDGRITVYKLHDKDKYSKHEVEELSKTYRT